LAVDGGNLSALEGLKLPDAHIIAPALHHGKNYLISNDEPVRKEERTTILHGDLKVLYAAEFVIIFENNNVMK
jgi:hypothetical protein